MSSSRRTRRARHVVAGVAALAAASGGLAACDYGPDGEPRVVTVVGAATTENVTGALVASYNADTRYNEDPDIPGRDADDLFNVRARQATPLPVPGDAVCPARTWHLPPGPGEVPSPEGSYHGRAALRAAAGSPDVCVDVARSSAPPRPVGDRVDTDRATFEYYAFALDAVAWSSASTLAPANLSLAELRGIYDCTYTDWSQVGGAAGPIERYWPTHTSGTREFLTRDVLGFDPTAATGCPQVTLVAGDDGGPVAVNGDQQRAIPEAPVAEENVSLNGPAAYPGIHYVFHVLDSTTPSYEDAVRYFGFDDAGDRHSPLCGGAKAGIVGQYGFGPLAARPSQSGDARFTCRLFTP